jgi:hypothetical protein
MDGMKTMIPPDSGLISINKSEIKENLAIFSLSISRVMFFAEHGWYENMIPPRFGSFQLTKVK